MCRRRRRNNGGVWLLFDGAVLVGVFEFPRFLARHRMNSNDQIFNGSPIISQRLFDRLHVLPKLNHDSLGSLVPHEKPINHSLI